MPRYRIQIDGKPQVTAGPTGAEVFNITVHDGYSSDGEESPKIIAMTFENHATRGAVAKYWLEENIEIGTCVQIDVLDSGEVNAPSRVDNDEQPLDMCWYCFKTADQVEYLVRAPKGTMHICNSCVDICAEEIDKRRASLGKDA